MADAIHEFLTFTRLFSFLILLSLFQHQGERLQDLLKTQSLVADMYVAHLKT